MLRREGGKPKVKNLERTAEHSFYVIVVAPAPPLWGDDGFALANHFLYFLTAKRQGLITVSATNKSGFGSEC